MKKIFNYTLAVMATMILFACQAVVFDEPVQNTQTKEVSFSMLAEHISPIGVTRVANGTPTSLMVLDYMGDKLIKVYTRNAGDAETDLAYTNLLEDITLNLTHGDHTLYFIASETKWESYDTTAGTISWNKAKQTWAVKKEVTVTASTATQEVSMPVKVAYVVFKMEDAIPPHAAKATLTLSKGSTVFNYKTMTGGAGTEVSSSASVASVVGQAGRGMSLYTFVPSDAAAVTVDGVSAFSAGEGILKVTDSSDKEISSRSKNNLGIKEGYETTVSGIFFQYTDQPFSLQLGDWTGNITYNQWD